MESTDGCLTCPFEAPFGGFGSHMDALFTHCHIAPGFDRGNRRRFNPCGSSGSVTGNHEWSTRVLRRGMSGAAFRRLKSAAQVQPNWASPTIHRTAHRPQIWLTTARLFWIPAHRIPNVKSRVRL